MEYYIMNDINKNTKDEKRDQENNTYVSSQNGKLEENCNTNVLSELPPQFQENVPESVSTDENCWSVVNNMSKTLHVTSTSSSPEPDKFLNYSLRYQQNDKDEQKAEDKKHSEFYDMVCTAKTVIGDTQQDCSAQETIHSKHDLLAAMSKTSILEFQRSSNTSVKTLQTGEFDTEDSSELQRKMCMNFSDSQQPRKYEEYDRIELSEFSRNCERNVSESPEFQNFLNWYRTVPLDCVKSENVGISTGSVLFSHYMSLKGDNQTDKTCFAKDEINTRNSEGQTVTTKNCGKRYSEGQTKAESISDPQNNTNLTFAFAYLNNRSRSGEFSDSCDSDEFSDNCSYEEFSDSWGCEEFSGCSSSEEYSVYSGSEECSSTSGSREFSNSSSNEECLDGSNSEVRSDHSGNEDCSGSEEYSVISSSEECSDISGNVGCSSSETCSGNEAQSSSSGNENRSGSEARSNNSSSEECSESSGNGECSDSEESSDSPDNGECSASSSNESCSDSEEYSDSSANEEYSDSSTYEECSDTSGNEECSDTSGNEECSDTSGNEECSDTSGNEECSDTSGNEECSDTSGNEECSDTSGNEECSDTSGNEEYSDTSSNEEYLTMKNVQIVKSIQTV